MQHCVCRTCPDHIRAPARTDGNCATCTSEGQQPIIRLNCGHSFHHYCSFRSLEEGKQDKCPICRQDYIHPAANRPPQQQVVVDLAEQLYHCDYCRLSGCLNCLGDAECQHEDHVFNFPCCGLKLHAECYQRAWVNLISEQGATSEIDPLEHQRPCRPHQGNGADIWSPCPICHVTLPKCDICERSSTASR